MEKQINKLISSIKHWQYNLSEPLLLATQRHIYERNYFSNDEEPLISVYVPTYNRCELLMDRAVKSVLSQTYTNFEFIIIGDCCTDDTEDAVKEIDDPRIKFHNIPKRGYRYPPSAENHWYAGPVVAANQALSMVKGKWIARIDDDDLWTEKHLEVLLKFAQKDHWEFVSSAYSSFRYGEEKVVSMIDEEIKIGGTQTWLYRSYLKFFRYNIHCWRKAWNRVNDTDIQDRMYRAGVNMGYLDEVTCKIIPRPGETTIGLDAYRQNRGEKEQHFKFS
jgi:O-antigen biosynthesis protein